MSHFCRQALVNVTPSEEQDDFTCQRENGTRIKVQVVEVVDQLKRKLEEQRKSYSEKLISDFPAIAQSLSGCRLTVVDTGQEPVLPPVKSKEGLRCLNELATHIQNLGVENLPAGKRRVRKHSIGSARTSVSFVCERLTSTESSLPMQLHWSGGRFVDNESEYRLLIANTIAKKIHMRYSKPKEEFWLLVYSRDVLATAKSPEIREAAILLKKAQHPFDKVWFLFPYSNQKLGHLIQIWP